MQKQTRFMRTLPLAAGLLALGCQTTRTAPPAPTPTPTPTATHDTTRRNTATSSPQGQAAAADAPKPYNRVITEGAKSRDGLFKTHMVGTKLYFEIPSSALNKDLLLVVRTARTALNVGYGGSQVGSRRVV